MPLRVTIDTIKSKMHIWLRSGVAFIHKLKVEVHTSDVCDEATSSKYRARVH